jgi:hypothetical protein
MRSSWGILERLVECAYALPGSRPCRGWEGGIGVRESGSGVAWARLRESLRGATNDDPHATEDRAYAVFFREIEWFSALLSLGCPCPSSIRARRRWFSELSKCLKKV